MRVTDRGTFNGDDTLHAAGAGKSSPPSHGATPSASNANFHALEATQESASSSSSSSVAAAVAAAVVT